ncbi:MAG: hypothetical protein IJL76_01650 [Bacilli bacterium]|nr:hypothetical protein [Bacilli bacterium]
MAKYYVVARIEDSYDLIKIGDKTKLEEIDQYTLNFRNKDELVLDMNTKGNEVDPESDIFIVYKNRGNIVTKEVLYKGRKNFNIRENIDLSLKGEDLKCFYIFKEVFEMSKNIEFANMLLSPVYSVYKEFKDLLYNSHKNINSVTFNSKNNFLRRSYNNLRDLCVLMNDYETMMPKRSFPILSRKTDLERERRVIFPDLSRTLGDGFGQLSLLGGPNNFVHITSLNPSKIPSKHTLKGSKLGTITPKKVSSNISVTTPPTMAISMGSTPYKLDMDSIEKINLCYQNNRVKQEAVKGIMKFLTSAYYMPADAIRSDGDKYYVNFDAFGYDYTDDQKDELSTLLSQNMMGLIKGYKDCEVRRRDPHISYGSQLTLDEDMDSYKKDIKHYLERYAEKNSKSINKIYRFCQVQRDVIDNTKGKSR